MYYDPISSGYIGILPEGPLVILVEVFEALKLVYLEFNIFTPEPVFLVSAVRHDVAAHFTATIGTLYHGNTLVTIQPRKVSRDKPMLH